MNFHSVVTQILTEFRENRLQTVNRSLHPLLLSALSTEQKAEMSSLCHLSEQNDDIIKAKP